MRIRKYIKLAGNVLACLAFIDSFCDGRGEAKLKYLYDGDASNLFVQEFVGDSDSRPDFIYSPTYPNGRIVTYYAHWCPHCIRFKPKYISLANEIHERSQNSEVAVETFAVSCVPQRKICNDHKINSYPTVMFYPPNSINGTKLKHAKLQLDEIFKLAGVSTNLEVGGDGVGATQQFSANDPEKQKNAAKAYFMNRKTSEALHDAHVSFDFVMKTAVFTQNGPLPDKPKEALRDFLLAMKMTLPPSSSMHPVVRSLLINFESITKSPDGINEVMAKYPPPEPSEKWSEASLQHGTGFTAGLWILFHIMSVGLVQWNHDVNDDAQKLAPADMADTLRDFVEHFFQCEECRLHFLASFDACSFDRCNRLVTTTVGATVQQYIQYPLWLYETHNAVNVRLRKERIEEGIESADFTAEGDVVWPPFYSCPHCWPSRGKDHWDEVEVYRFLQQSYWQEEDRESEILRILAPDSMNRHYYEYNAAYDDGSSFSLFSIGSSCSILVAVAILVYFKRRQRDKKGKTV